MNDYIPIIGLEIHVELKTKSKMFCGCKNDPFHAEKPNIYTCPVCLGMPGGIPVPNKTAIEWTIMLGQALGCEIPLFSKFDRKNYFYPDLAKGYQISQYDQPFATNGALKIGYQIPGTKNEVEKIIRIRRVHLEEDTGKLQHATVAGKKVTLVDFNRSGVPLVEIVTEPDIRSGEEAKAFLKKLHQIIRYLNISDANMEEGSMRLEPNISVKMVKKDQNNDDINGIIQEKDLPKYKVEVKNINSFNFVKKAIEFEVPRHREILEKGNFPVQETRGWNEAKGETVSQRRKEDADDYRYFPDPDIPPFRFTHDQLSAIRRQLPELPEAKQKRFIHEYEIPEATAEVLINDIAVANYFEVAVAKKIGVPKVIANWIVNKKIDIQTLSVDELLIQVLQATTVVELPDLEIKKSIESVLSANPKAVTDYKSGKEAVIMFLFGQVMKALHGKGEKGKIQQLIKDSLYVK